MHLPKWARSVSALACVFAFTSISQAIDFDPFYIRNNDGSIAAPWDADLMIAENPAGDGFAAQTPRPGQKVGYGTNAFDGQKVNQLGGVDFTKDSGEPNKYPYLNLWVTDGINFAILALGGDFRGVDFLSGAQDWLIYEFNSANPIDWLFDSGTTSLAGSGHSIRKDGGMINLSDLSDSILFADPGSPYPSYVGTGAPRGGYGLNMIFGDTQANYVGNMEISDLTVTYNGQSYSAGNAAVPDTGATVGLLGLAFATLLIAKRRLAHR